VAFAVDRSQLLALSPDDAVTAFREPSPMKAHKPEAKQS